jgi:2,3-bisphosphoglycerate-independent phosphoglycerate mutase
LEDHPVNRVRVDLGENPANMCWFWGASGAGPQRTFSERTNLSGAVVSRSFLLRGLARALSLDSREAPATFDDASVQHLTNTVAEAVHQRDFVYVHLCIETGNPVERLLAIERLDRLLIKSLTESLPDLGPWRLLVVIDDRTNDPLPFIAIGTGMPQQPIAHLNAEGFSGSPLTFRDGEGLFAWFTQHQMR